MIALYEGSNIVCLKLYYWRSILFIKYQDSQIVFQPTSSSVLGSTLFGEEGGGGGEAAVMKKLNISKPPGK